MTVTINRPVIYNYWRYGVRRSEEFDCFDDALNRYRGHFEELTAVGESIRVGERIYEGDELLSMSDWDWKESDNGC